MEQIINEGSLGEVERIPSGGCYNENAFLVTVSTANKIVKTQAEQDYEHLKTKLINGEIVCISEQRYNGLLKLAYINKEVDEWFNALNSKVSVILIPDVTNIGIVKC